MDINNNSDIYSEKIIKKFGLIFELNHEEKTANVVDNDQAYGNIFIPKLIKYKKDEFVVKSIKFQSFKNTTKIKSLEFSRDSEVKVIEKEAFFNSTIESIYIPASISTLEEGWCRGTSNLRNIKVDPNNKCYIILDNKILIGKSNNEKLEYDEIIFVVRDVNKLLIPSFIKRICKYSISETSIENIFIPSNVIEICEGSFYNCVKLKLVEISFETKLQHISKYSFLKTSISSIIIPSTVTIEDQSFDERTKIIKAIISITNENEYHKNIKKLADEGDIQSMIKYATMLYYGYGIKENKKESSVYFKLASEKGDVQSMFMYGAMLYLGDGIFKNKKEASIYFKKAADKGHIESMIKYANMIKNGDGIEMNKEEAYRYFKLANDKDQFNSMNKNI